MNKMIIVLLIALLIISLFPELAFLSGSQNQLYQKCAEAEKNSN